MKKCIAAVILLLFALSAFAEPIGTTGYELTVPEGYTLVNDASDDDPMFYCYPEDAASPVRFLFYTSGKGDCEGMAQTALQNYSMFYDSFEATEIHEESYAGHDVITFSYVCSYMDQTETKPLYEQTAICYEPLENDTFLAWIVSLSFDSEDAVLNETDLKTLLNDAASCVAAMK